MSLRLADRRRSGGCAGQGAEQRIHARVVSLDMVQLREATTTPALAGLVRPPCPRHHPSVGRGGRHRPDGAYHPRRHRPPSSTSATRVAAIRSQTERKRRDRSVRHVEKRHRWAWARPISGRTADTSRGRKSWHQGHNQATWPTMGSPFWRMSAGDARRGRLGVAKAQTLRHFGGFPALSGGGTPAPALHRPEFAASEQKDLTG